MSARVDVGPLGHVGAAICFDFDFPAFIAAAARGADLLLQPGADWGPLGLLHSEMGAMRAIENGITVFRCASGSVGQGLLYSLLMKSAQETRVGQM